VKFFLRSVEFFRSADYGTKFFGYDDTLGKTKCVFSRSVLLGVIIRSGDFRGAFGD
jgi:hypothetical protein